MTEEKWTEVFYEENVNAINTMYTNFEYEDVTPHNWNEFRKVVLNFVKKIDETTEVYFNENGRN